MNALGIDNHDGQFLTLKQVSTDCNLSLERVKKIAMESGSLIEITSRTKRIDSEKFYSYLRSHYAVNTETKTD